MRLNSHVHVSRHQQTHGWFCTTTARSGRRSNHHNSRPCGILRPNPQTRKLKNRLAKAREQGMSQNRHHFAGNSEVSKHPTQFFAARVDFQLQNADSQGSKMLVAGKIFQFTVGRSLFVTSGCFVYHWSYWNEAPGTTVGLLPKGVHHETFLRPVREKTFGRAAGVFSGLKPGHASRPDSPAKPSGGLCFRGCPVLT